MIIKCKICGGDIAVNEDKTFGTCEYCGSTMTLPKVSDEQRASLFNRGNHFRRQGEFDKALSVYENIVRENDADAEAHWCCALCRFGIEYVEDPNTFEYIPTCHRASFDSFLEDVDYLAALENSDGITKRQYQKDAAKIAEVQKGILATSQNEEPFDVFICYKETDDNTKERTKDSIDAQEIYYQLTNEGYRVFFSRITLEDKVGAEYEPYIFAALNSAKVMVAVGSKPEYFNAVWVKNEWSRFLALMRKDRSKLLLPCYKGMDPYDLPEQLSVLQSYDMGKIGFIQDLIRGVKKVLRRDEPAPTVVQQTVVQQTAAPAGNAAPLLRRAFMFLEDGDWAKADDFAEQVLNIEPENAEAYVAKLMSELKVRKRENLPDCPQPFDGSNNFNKAVRFGDEKLKNELSGCVSHIKERNELNRKTSLYDSAMEKMSAANTEKQFKAASAAFELVPGFRDADKLAAQCLERAEISRKDEVYERARKYMAENTISGYEAAIKNFETGWKDADAQINACQRKIEEIKAKREADRIAAEKNAKKQKTATVIVLLAAALCAAFVILLFTVIVPSSKYKAAVKLYEAGKYDEAAAAFEAMDGYKDSEDRTTECRYNAAIKLYEAGKYDEAAAAFEAMNGYRDSEERVRESRYKTAEELLRKGEFASAALKFSRSAPYSDAEARSKALWDKAAVREALSAGGYYTVGLRADGTVVAVGSNFSGQCGVSGWKDIVAVSAGYSHTVGLRADGTVVAVGSNDYGWRGVSGWKDIVAVSAGFYHIVGLRSDGTVVAVGKNDYGQCDVSGWTDIVAVSAGSSHTVGLRADGTVVAVGSNYSGKCDVSGWKDIVAVSAGCEHTVGLRADGTVVAVGDNDDGKCDVSGWTDIVAVSAGFYHTVGLRSDGTVVAVGDNDDGQCSVSGWRGIRIPTRSEK